jgi:hypothetical protein
MRRSAYPSTGSSIPNDRRSSASCSTTPASTDRGRAGRRRDAGARVDAWPGHPARRAVAPAGVVHTLSAYRRST